MLRNVANIYVSIFGKSLHFWRLGYILMIYPTLYVIFSNIIFNKKWSKLLTFMLALLFQISIFELLYNKNYSLYDIMLW